MYGNLIKQYETPPPPGNPRASEAWAFLQAALRLHRASESGDRTEIQAAVRLNWRLWTIVQADLLDANCQVPAEIRGNMLSLAAFVDKHSVATLARPTPEAVKVLIGINREISAGLSVTPEAESEQKTVQGGVTA